MDKKTTGYVLVSFGVLDFILSFVGMDITYWLIGDLSTYSPYILGAIGYYLIDSASKENSNEDAAIEEGEDHHEEKKVNGTE
tara:strand:+ start:23 stop:268 length:246 start_codon:yes stop_codon:yes gene_type:complete